MLILNKVSRYDIARVAIKSSRKGNAHVDSVADKLLQDIDKQVENFWAYIKENGKGQTIRISLLLIADLHPDPDGIFDMPKF
jgi:hypothetical protein